MSERDRDTEERQRTGKREQDRSSQRRTTQDHRLRGNEFADDFVDADADSSVAASHRIDKESDS